MTALDRAPAFPFYASDYLSDPKVSSMSYDQQGRYVKLLAQMWVYGDAGCHMPRVTAERNLGKPFVRFITEPPMQVIELTSIDGVDCLFSNRLFQEAQKCRSRREAATRSANARWGNRNANA